MEAIEVKLKVSESGNELAIIVDGLLAYRTDSFGQVWYRPSAIAKCDGGHRPAGPVKYMGAELRVENWCLYCPDYAEGQILWLKTGWVEPLHPVEVIKQRQPLEMAERKEC